MLLNESEGPNGTLYAHVARANPQWKLMPSGEAMAIFAGPEPMFPKAPTKAGAVQPVKDRPG
jgi:predicted FMN-binding regulatory protein PaiB